MLDIVRKVKLQSFVLFFGGGGIYLSHYKKQKQVYNFEDSNKIPSPKDFYYTCVQCKMNSIMFSSFDSNKSALASKNNTNA